MLTVNTSTNAISKGSAFEFDTKNGRYPASIKIGTNRILCAYQATNSKGWAQILNVAPATGKITKQATIVFDSSKCVYPALAQVTADKYICAYQAQYDFGAANILNTDLKILP